MNFQCHSCFEFFDELPENNQCPICGSDAIYGVWESSQDQDDYYN